MDNYQTAVPEAQQIQETAPAAEPQGAMQRISEAQITEALTTLKRYKDGKKSLDTRIVANNEWYRMRHWKQMSRGAETGTPEPASAWLFNSLANKHADAMDNYPEPNVLPNEPNDGQEAQKLSKIIPVVLEQNDFETAYSKMWWSKLESGTGAYGVFWDSRKLNGLGDIDITSVDILNLFWEPGITDLQKSRNLFCVELVDNDLLERAYPQLKGKLGGTTIDVSKYIYDDTVDTSDKSYVIDWYYKVSEGGRQVLHYCKFVGTEVLYASENDPTMQERGFYDHGKYPFVLDVLFPEKGTPFGFGYVDIMRDAQTYIDKIGQAFMENALSSATPRYFVRDDGSINEDEFRDTRNHFIHVTGTKLGDDSIRPVDSPQLSAVYLNVLQEKIDELKETSGNRDFSQGGTTSGVTAASAISALMEAGSKLSRDANKSAYRAYKEVCYLVIELIRQFYDEPRTFRIVGDMGRTEFVQYDNAAIRPVSMGTAFGVDQGYRLPTFDITVAPQKASAYSKMAQNELALQLYQLGIFNPQTADQALACVKMMDFRGREDVIDTIQRNQTLLQMVQMYQALSLQLAQQLDAATGSQAAAMVAQNIAASGGVTAAGGGGSVDLSGGNGMTMTEQMVQTAQDQAAPR